MNEEIDPTRISTYGRLVPKGRTADGHEIYTMHATDVPVWTQQVDEPEPRIVLTDPDVFQENPPRRIRMTLPATDARRIQQMQTIHSEVSSKLREFGIGYQVVARKGDLSRTVVEAVVAPEATVVSKFAEAHIPSGARLHPPTIEATVEVVRSPTRRSVHKERTVTLLTWLAGRLSERQVNEEIGDLLERLDQINWASPWSAYRDVGQNIRAIIWNALRYTVVAAVFRRRT